MNPSGLADFAVGVRFAASQSHRRRPKRVARSWSPPAPTDGYAAKSGRSPGYAAMGSWPPAPRAHVGQDQPVATGGFAVLQFARPVGVRLQSLQSCSNVATIVRSQS